jgi:hypothetical protein
VLILSLLDLPSNFVKILRKPLEATFSFDGVLYGRQEDRPNCLQGSLNSVPNRLLTHLIRIQLTSRSLGAVGTKIQQALVSGRIPSKSSSSDAGTGGGFGRSGVHVARSVIICALPRTAGIKVTVPIVGIFLVDAAAHWAVGVFISVDDCEPAGRHNAAQGLTVFHAILSASTTFAFTSYEDIFKQRSITFSAKEVIVWLKLSATTRFDLVQLALVQITGHTASDLVAFLDPSGSLEAFRIGPSLDRQEKVRADKRPRGKHDYNLAAAVILGSHVFEEDWLFQETRLDPQIVTGFVEPFALVSSTTVLH